MTQITLIDIKIIDGIINFIQLNVVWCDLLKNKLNLVAKFFEDILNLFYSVNTILLSFKYKLVFKTITIEFQNIIVMFSMSILIYLNVTIGLLLLNFLFFKYRFILVNSDLLNILHDDSVDSSDADSTESDPHDDDSTESSEDSMQQFILFLQKELNFDSSGIIEVLIASLRNSDDELENERCLTPDMYIEKLMLSSGVSKNDLLKLKKNLCNYFRKSKKEKIKCLSQKSFYSLHEVLKLMKSLNNLKKSIIVLPSGMVILTISTKNLNLLSLPAVLKVSQKNLNWIVHSLNLKKRLNLYLTKDCYNLGYVWEKSFYTSDFLNFFPEYFNKDYLILESLNLNVINLVKFKLDYFYCDTFVLEEIKLCLSRIIQSSPKECKVDDQYFKTTPEIYEKDLLTNQVSADVILDGIIKIKSQPKTKKKLKKNWFIDFFTFIKNKIQDLTIPAVVVYYYFFKILYFTPLKYLLIFAVILFILYKYVYLHPNFSTMCRWFFWFFGFTLYTYFLYLIWLNNIDKILSIVSFFVDLLFDNFFLKDITLISLICLVITLPSLVINSDIVYIFWYNILLLIHDWLVDQLDHYTLFSLYLWPYIYVFVNIREFIIYAWNTSYYRDSFIYYFSKVLAIVYLYLFPLTFHLNVINAGRISSFLRWIYWNPKWFTELKYFFINYCKVIYAILARNIKNYCRYYLQFIYEILPTKYFFVRLLIYFFAILLFMYLFNKFLELIDEKRNKRNGFMEYFSFSDTFGDKIKEKLFDLIPLRYKLTFETFNIEWLEINNYEFLTLLNYGNIIYNFLLKNLWLYFKYIIYTKFEGSLVEFYCEMHLWLEYYLFLILGDFLEPFFFIPHYVNHTNNYLIEIPWKTFMDMYLLVDYFGMQPLINSIEAYVLYRVSLLKYQYYFWKNYQYEFNRKRVPYLHINMLLYWKIYFHYQLKQRAETRERIFKSWYIWWDKGDTF